MKGRQRNLLATLREERGLKQEFVAKAIGAHPTSLCRWETLGEHNPEKRTVRVLAEFYNVEEAVVREAMKGGETR